MFANSAVRIASKSVVPRRSLGTLSQIISSPPAVRISFPEKIVHGLLISAAICAYPIYAVMDIRKERVAKFGAED